MRISTRLIAAATLIAGTAAAQFRPVSLEFSPAVATEGQPVQITVRCESGMFNWDPCGFYQVHPGSQSAPAISHYAFCTRNILIKNPWELHTAQWDLNDYSTSFSGTPVAPGEYWIHVNCQNQMQTAVYDEWFCLTVVPASSPPGSVPATIEPSLGSFQVGTTTQIRVSSPDDAMSIYQMYFSFDSNMPIGVPGFVEFGLSAPIYLWGGPTPLDALGNSTFRLGLLNQPHVVDRAFVLQVQVVDLITGLPKASNCLSVMIKP